MMRFPRQTSVVIFFTFIFIVFACREEAFIEEADLVDEDLLAATQLADDYLLKERGRTSDERSITVFRYKDDEVYFNTNTDSILEYQILTEESVTANVSYGEYIFWYSGGGMSDLDGIEFDSVSEEFLEEFPEEINYDKMWVIKMPEKDEVEADGEVVLKYDILYQYRGYEGEPIRLDPKIRVDEGDEDEDVEN